MTIIERKKLAIIKSNAAPEIKLRALQRVNNVNAADILKREATQKLAVVKSKIKEIQQLTKQAETITKNTINESSLKEVIEFATIASSFLDKIIWQDRLID